MGNGICQVASRHPPTSNSIWLIKKLIATPQILQNKQTSNTTRQIRSAICRDAGGGFVFFRRYIIINQDTGIIPIKVLNKYIEIIVTSAGSRLGIG